MVYTFTLDTINETAQQVLRELNQKVVLFYGAMGAGKTTFIKALAKAMSIEDKVNSPTFALVNEYLTLDNQSVYHFDFYRINDEQEALNIGVEEYFYSGNYCLVEWPEKIPSLLPDEVNIIRIKANADGERELAVD